MGKIIAISNQKGGVGKTTTTGALAAAFKKRGRHVLAVDLDPQGNLSFSMGADNEGVPTSYELLQGAVTAQDTIQTTEVVNMIPANILLSGSDLEFTGLGREFLLANALRPIRDRYDYILIDTPPALGVLTVNAFTASDSVIIPMLCDMFSLQGIMQLSDTVRHVQQNANRNLRVEGVLLTRYAPRTTLASEVRGTAELVTEQLGIPMFDVCIRNSVTITEAQALQRDIIRYSPRNIAVKDYLALADEILNREK